MADDFNENTKPDIFKPLTYEFSNRACESHLLNSRKQFSACTRQVVLKWLCNSKTRFSWPSLNCFISARFHSQLNSWPMPDENSFSFLQIQMRRLRGRVEAFQCHNLSKFCFQLENTTVWRRRQFVLPNHRRLDERRLCGVENLLQLLYRGFSFSFTKEAATRSRKKQN